MVAGAAANRIGENLERALVNLTDGAEGANANTWVSLGQYRFAAGQDAATGSVNVSEETVSGKPHSGWNQRVCADSAKWVFMAP